MCLIWLTGSDWRLLLSREISSRCSQSQRVAGSSFSLLYLQAQIITRRCGRQQGRLWLTSSQAFAEICSCPLSPAGLEARCAAAPETPVENSCQFLHVQTVQHACASVGLLPTFRKKLEDVVRHIQSSQLGQPPYFRWQL